MTDDFHSTGTQPNRRTVMMAGAGLSAIGLSALTSSGAAFGQAQSDAKKSPESLLAPGQTILFQGDSITDAGRTREKSDPNSFAGMGGGYAWLAAAQLLAGDPEAGYKIHNRGISGHKVPQLAERWQVDCLDLKPDVLSILIGVNDYWHGKDGRYDGTVATYERDYRDLIQRTRKALPQTRLVICEPFLLMSGNVNKERTMEFAEYRAAARRVAEEANAKWVPFQEMFDHACKFAEPRVWAEDGVHPSTHGAALMARWWLNTVG